MARMKICGELALLADAGCLVGYHAMAWSHRLNVLFNEAWDTVDTKCSFARWRSRSIHMLEPCVERCRWTKTGTHR